MIIPLLGTSLKIERAHQHFRELVREMDVFRNRLPFRYVVERNLQVGNPGQPALVFRKSEDIPIYWSSIIGDIVHNLRAALDLIVCDVVSLHDGRWDKCRFPFASNPEEFESELERVVKKPCPNIRQNFLDMISALKPYRGGNDALRGLHDLDIRDKHRVLIITQVILPLPNFPNFYGNVAEGLQDGTIIRTSYP